jgi:hypothetical protein
MSDQSGLADDLLRGAAAIAQEMFGKRTRAAQRKVYHLRPQLGGTVFQLDDNGMLLAFRSRLRAQLERRAQEEEQRVAALEAAKAVVTPSKSRRRRRAA